MTSLEPRIAALVGLCVPLSLGGLCFSLTHRYEQAVGWFAGVGAALVLVRATSSQILWARLIALLVVVVVTFLFGIDVAYRYLMGVTLAIGIVGFVQNRYEGAPGKPDRL